MLDLFALLVFAGLLLAAAACDVARMKIPNALSAALAAAFVPLAFALRLPVQDIGLHLLFGASILLIGYLLFQIKVLGGGDAKLIAAAAVWTGAPAFLYFFAFTAVAGGVLALGFIALRLQFAPANALPAFVNRLLTPGGGLPYGVAIAAGGIIATQAIPFLSSALTLP